ncbi:MAG: hypothetical protein Ta2B_26410 [Termitinemataceae bacterium]|nr:MAG: hypothetical protein Ta2B_26410 [Termitinemataceae bacterium]
MKKIIVIEEDKVRMSILKLELKKLSEYRVIGTGINAYDAINLTDKYSPDIAVVSYDLSLLSGSNLCKTLYSRLKSIQLVFVLDKVIGRDIIELLKNSVSGLILKSHINTDICKAIISINKGNVFMSKAIMQKTVNLYCDQLRRQDHIVMNRIIPKKDNDTKKLTMSIGKAEFRIVKYIGAGLTNKDIAKILNIRVVTVQNYISLILKKTGVADRAQIALYAINNCFTNKNDILNYVPSAETGKRNILSKTDPHMSKQADMNEIDQQCFDFAM